MHFMNLIMLYDFIHVINITKKHPIKIEHFSKHTLFATISLLQEHKLNHRNCSEQEINIRNFVQATEHYVHMYANFGGFTFYVFL
jgi:hypothetical protein